MPEDRGCSTCPYCGRTVPAVYAGRHERVCEAAQKAYAEALYRDKGQKNLEDWLCQSKLNV